MKKCPKCHKNIPSNAKVCPYCGTPQSGYQPMKRTPKKKIRIHLSNFDYCICFLTYGNFLFLCI